MKPELHDAITKLLSVCERAHFVALDQDFDSLSEIKNAVRDYNAIADQLGPLSAAAQRQLDLEDYAEYVKHHVHAAAQPQPAVPA